MATTSTTLISNLNSSPPIMNEVGESGGRVRACVGNFEWVGATLTTAGDFARLCRLPSNARIVHAAFYNDTLDGSASIILDLGLAPIDADISTSTHTLAVNAISDGHIGFRSASVGDATGGIDMMCKVAGDLTKFGSKLHTLAGDTTDPGGHYDVIFHASAPAASDATGTVAFVIQYTVD